MSPLKDGAYDIFYYFSQQCEEQYIALHVAERDSKECLELLLSHCADTNIKDMVSNYNNMNCIDVQ